MAQQSVRILEKGNIVFFYRPKKGVTHPQSPDDLERAFFALLPDDQEQHKNRLFNVAHGVLPAIVPGKALPEERDWAFVQDVSSNPRQVIDALEKERQAPPPAPGERVRPWARAAGEGRYALTKHQDHTHLAYWLHRPECPGEVQQEMQIRPEASYIISVKEPYAPSEIRLDKRPDYPESLRRKFDGHGWVAAEPTEFLDYPYAQVLLVGAETNVQRELGIALDPREENKASQIVLHMLEQEEKEASRQGVSVLEPLAQGRWE
ncbi:MAG TPA: hypothetical protein PLJ35_20245 [Anaerolineae bacterium]|nr:hypothetical protein [Anaerolineae bacterium]HOR01153.1 hypothetical protein [Anaerolineae bacterium]HPL30271.1 hypothetical protein [Anaerolineae bacterium]